MGPRTYTCGTPQEWTTCTYNEELICINEDLLDTNELNQLRT